MTKTADKDNIHHDIAGEDIFPVEDEKFRTYRRLWIENPQNLKNLMNSQNSQQSQVS